MREEPLFPSVFTAVSDDAALTIYRKALHRISRFVITDESTRQEIANDHDTMTKIAEKALKDASYR